MIFEAQQRNLATSQYNSQTAHRATAFLKLPTSHSLATSSLRISTLCGGYSITWSDIICTPVEAERHISSRPRTVLQATSTSPCSFLQHCRISPYYQTANSLCSPTSIFSLSFAIDPPPEARFTIRCLAPAVCSFGRLQPCPRSCSHSTQHAQASPVRSKAKVPPPCLYLQLRRGHFCTTTP